MTQRRYRYEIVGVDSNEVLAVMREVHRQRLQESAPWRAGMFYLLCLAIVAGVFLAVARLVPYWALPLIVVAALIGVVIVGALQQRQDGSISEKGLLGLIKAAFRTARSVSGGSQQI
jgi:4-amino-4-deoxy-L-arabinose transferase-like glycosyltransferase